MKTSVIFGVAHMVLGIVLKGANAIYFDRGLDFKHEFLPQLLMLICMFGYMDLLIIVKWNTDWSGNTARAPSIVSMMVGLFLNYGALNPAEDALLPH